MITGISSPKFIYDLGGANEATVSLEYSVITENAPEPKLYEHVSVVNGHREIENVGRHWNFELRIHLFKYSDPLSKLNQIRAYEGKDVTLYAHGDGPKFNQLFILASVEEAYWDTPDYKDVLILKFRSKDYTSPEYASISTPQLSEIVIGGITQ